MDSIEQVTDENTTLAKHNLVENYTNTETIKLIKV